MQGNKVGAENSSVQLCLEKTPLERIYLDTFNPTIFFQSIQIMTKVSFNRSNEKIHLHVAHKKNIHRARKLSRPSFIKPLRGNNKSFRSFYSITRFNISH